MTKPVFANVKLVGTYADRIEREATERRVSKSALVTDYTLRGLELSSSANDTALDSFERRIAATVLAARGDVEAVQSELDTLVAMFDLFIKLMLLHLPEPAAEESDAVRSSALTRYERFLKQVANNGFDGDRPQALIKIASLLTKKVGSENG